MLLLVGLGNPGAGYAKHRHNIGFMTMEEIAKAHDFSAWKAKFQSRVAEGKFGRQKVICLKPETYMNLSGQAVAEALKFYKIPLENLYVFHDDLDLAKGKVRIKQGGGHGGHNGLRSIDGSIGPDYHRVRLGIGHPGKKDLVHGYVLQDFTAEELESVKLLTKGVADNLELLLENKEADFMNKLSLATKPAKTEANAGKPGRVVRGESAVA
jgi:PTH1 family peptidyl-tRNA hydrolase